MDWELAAGLGRGQSKSAILQKKEEISPTFFATNYESKWVGNQPLVAVMLHRKLNEPRSLGCVA